VARILFAIWQLYAVTQGASVLLLGFTFFEVIFAILQGWPVHEAARTAIERVKGRADPDFAH